MQITLATHIIYRIKYYTQSELIFLLMSAILVYLFFWLQLVLNMEDNLILC